MLEKERSHAKSSHILVENIAYQWSPTFLRSKPNLNENKSAFIRPCLVLQYKEKLILNNDETQ